MNSPVSRCVVLASCVLGLWLGNAFRVQGQTNGTWNLNGSGNWSATANWLGGTIPDGGGIATFSDAFGQSGGLTVTIDTTSRTLSQINYDSGYSFTLAASGGGSIIMPASGSLTLNAVNSLISSPTTYFTTANSISAPITGTGNLIKIGNGSVALTSTANTFTGSISVNQGALFVTGGNGALGNIANSVTINGAIFGTTTNALTTDRAFTIGAGGATFRTFAAVTLNGTLSGTGLLVKQIANANLTIGGDGTAFTGGVRIDGGAIELASNGRIGAGPAVEVAGTLTLNNTATNLTNRLGGREVFIRGGNFNFTGNAAGSSDTAGALTLGQGTSFVTVTAATNAATITFANLTRLNNAVGFFRGTNFGAGAGAGNVEFTTAPTGLIGGGGDPTTQPDASILPYVYGNTSTTGVNGSTFLSVVGNRLVPLNLTSGYVTDITTATPTQNVNLTADATLGAPTTINALRLAPAAAATLSGTDTLTITSGAILNTSTATTAPLVTIATPITAGSQELVVISTNGGATSGLALTGVISGTGGLTRAGPGSVTLSGANTYTGLTTLAGGLTVVGTTTLTATGSAPSAFGQATSPINITGSGGAVRLWTTGDLVINRNLNVTLGGTGIVGLGTAGLSANESVVVNGNVTLNAPASFTNSFLFSEGGNERAEAVTFNGIISGTGGLRGNFGSYTILNGNNTFTGNSLIGATGFAVGSGITATTVGETWEIGSNSAFGTGGTIFWQSFTPASPSNPVPAPATLVAGGGPRTISNPVVVFNGLANFAGNNPITLSGPVELNGGSSNVSLLTVGADSPVTISGTVSRGGLVKGGPGTLTLTGTNQYTGQTVIRRGVLSVGTIGDAGVASNLGAGPITASFLILSGNDVGQAGVLRYTGSGSTTNRLFTLAGVGGTIDASGSGPLVFSNTGNIVMATPIGSGSISGASFVPNAGVIALSNLLAAQMVVGSTLTGNPEIPAGTTITEVGENYIRLSQATTNTTALTGQSFTVTFPTSVTSRTLTLTGNNTGLNTIAGVLANGGGLNLVVAKTGPGTWQLTNANTYSGGTTISAGTLQVNNTTGSGTGTGAITVEANGTLAGTGRVAPTGGAAVNISGRVQPGPAAGSNLRIEPDTGAINFSAGSILALHVATAGPSAAANTGGSTLGTVPNPTNTVFITLNASGGINFDPGTIFEIDGTGAGFTLNQPYSYQVGLLTPAPTPLNFTNQVNFVAIGFTGSAFSLTSDASGAVFLNFTPVPEPSTVLLLSGVILGLTGCYRSRRIKA